MLLPPDNRTFNLVSEQPKIFTLKQVVSSIRKTIEDRYQQFYWVKAEMHKLNRFPSGHCFPELVQKEDGRIVAEMRGTIWAHQFERINQRFMEVVKEPLKEDSTLLMQVKVSFHETYGLSLQIVDIDPNYALGELQKERQETLKKLEKEGLLRANQQLAFPLLPQRIAVISADASKGLSDFMQVLNTNEWGYAFFTMLFPAYLQGDAAANSIIQQLERIEKVKAHFDIVVIVRGGGGEVGLSCYNNYALCKAIASFSLPVLTGIGHSTNLTVAEMISYRNAITPTELGDSLIQAFHNFSVPVKDAGKSIRVHTKNLLEKIRLEFNQTSRDFKHGTQQQLSDSHNELVRTGRALKSGVRFSLQQKHERLRSTRQQSLNAGSRLLERQQHQLNALVKELPMRSHNAFEKSRTELNTIVNTIRLMDPKNVLERGYSITTINGKTVSVSNVAEVGDELLTRTANFELKSTVTFKKETHE